MSEQTSISELVNIAKMKKHEQDQERYGPLNISPPPPPPPQKFEQDGVYLIEDDQSSYGSGSGSTHGPYTPIQTYHRPHPPLPPPPPPPPPQIDLVSAKKDWMSEHSRNVNAIVNAEIHKAVNSAISDPNAYNCRTIGEHSKTCVVCSKLYAANKTTQSLCYAIIAILVIFLIFVIFKSFKQQKAWVPR